ncbi:hypothetical protein C1H46_001171 [Malus baccata]|uniref:Uncharacterized protein n=1 Tax=Malus baccata TaxID=106549 RepID=A0A540NPX2_MALBA|nr:hypothetical protein C1H46_001171 [Malus baccata]
MVQAKSSEHMMTFYVMDSSSPYKAILGREWLHVMRKVHFNDRIPSRYPRMLPSSERFNNK